MLWEIDIYPAPGQPDRLALQVAADAAELGIVSELNVTAASGYLLQGQLERNQVQRLAEELFADRVAERAVVSQVGRGDSTDCANVKIVSEKGTGTFLLRGLRKNEPVPDRSKGEGAVLQPVLIHVLPKPGVMDPVAQSAARRSPISGSRSRPSARCENSGYRICRRKSCRCWPPKCWPTMPSNKLSLGR